MKKCFTLALLLCGFSLYGMATETLRAYNLPNGGYVIVDEENEPVVFGDAGTADNLAEPLRLFLGDADLQISSEPMPDAVRRVTNLVIADSVGPLLGGIMYDQTAPYNRQTPIYRNQHCLTGCVATAMAQIMKYWEYPAVCNNGTKNYTSSTNNISVSYTFDNVSFDWNLILDTYVTGAGHTYTEAQANEVAKLMAACGAAVEMDYGLDASGSISRWVPDALVAFFGYHMGISFENRDDFLDDDAVHAALVAEFNAGRPVYMSGASKDGGHAYVVDGYKTYVGAESRPFFHFNWGWSGVNNNWVTLRNSDYNQSISFIRGIIPETLAGVQNTEAERVVKAGTYDLLGNRVVEPIPGHIYIVDGEKVLVR